MKAFITATGTDIGKTYVTCGLLRLLRAQGNAVTALKPVVSGFDPAHPTGSDPALLLAAQDLAPSAQNIAAIAPWRFAAPLSPDHAARLEGRSVDYPDLLAFCRSHRDQAAGALLIEGVGGVMVPLDPTHTVLDLMADLALPAVLVAGAYLGTLSHTLTALAVLRARRLPCMVVLSQTTSDPPDVSVTAATIARHGQVTVAVLPVAPQPRHAAFAQIAQSVQSLTSWADSR